MLLVWLLLPGWWIVFMCSTLGCCCSSRARAGWEKKIPRAAVEALAARGKEGVKPMGCDLSVRLSIHGICAARKKVKLWIGREKE